MYFQVKNTLKSNHNHTSKQIKKKREREKEGRLGFQVIRKIDSHNHSMQYLFIYLY
jgi:hypothetical protein